MRPKEGFSSSSLEGRVFLSTKFCSHPLNSSKGQDRESQYSGLNSFQDHEEKVLDVPSNDLVNV